MEFINLKKIWDKNCFIILFFMFFIIHGEIIFNKISFWDDIISCFGTRFFMNEPLPHGRWLNHVFESVLREFAGTESLPVMNGIIVSACISAISLIIFSMFKITEFKLAFGLIFLSIPAVAGNLGYGFWAGKDFIGRLICVIAAYFTCLAIHSYADELDRKRSWSSYLAGIILFACALGEYQCYFAFYLTLCLFYFIHSVILENVSSKKFWSCFIYYILNIAGGLVLYLAILQFFLKFSGVQLLSYAGTNTYGIVSLVGYIERIIYAYSMFASPYLGYSANMYPFHWYGWYKLLLLVIFLILLLFCFSCIYRKRKNTLYQILLLIILVPGALNFNVVLYGWQDLHSLHMYHHSMLFLLPFILYRGLIINLSVGDEGNNKRTFKALRGFLLVTILTFGLLYVRYDNYCYMLSEFRQQQAIRYFTTLTTRIMSVNGYKKDMAVAFINERKKYNNIDEVHEYYDYPATNPFCYPIINSYEKNSRAFMKYWCGYMPEFVEDNKGLEDNSIVREMPCYPDEGSIKIIDNVIVVKF